MKLLFSKIGTVENRKEFTKGLARELSTNGIFGRSFSFAELVERILTRLYCPEEVGGDPQGKSFLGSRFHGSTQTAPLEISYMPETYPSDLIKVKVYDQTCLSFGIKMTSSSIYSELKYTLVAHIPQSWTNIVFPVSVFNDACEEVLLLLSQQTKGVNYSVEGLLPDMPTVKEVVTSILLMLMSGKDEQEASYDIPYLKTRTCLASNNQLMDITRTNIPVSYVSKEVLQGAPFDLNALLDRAVNNNQGVYLEAIRVFYLDGVTPGPVIQKIVDNTPITLSNKDALENLNRQYTTPAVIQQRRTSSSFIGRDIKIQNGIKRFESAYKYLGNTSMFVASTQCTVERLPRPFFVTTDTDDVKNFYSDDNVFLKSELASYIERA